MEIGIGVIGFVAGAVVSYLLFQKSSKELKYETARLCNLSNLILKALEAGEQNQLWSINRDDNGNPVAITFRNLANFQFRIKDPEE